MARRVKRELLLKVSSRGLKETQRGFRGLKSVIGGVKTGLRGLGPAIGATSIGLAGLTAVAIGASVGFKKLTGSIVGVGKEMEMAQVKLTTVLGDAAMAKSLMNDLIVMAKVTPFEITELIEASVILEAYGLNAEATLTTIGNAAGSLGKDVVGMAAAVGQTTTGMFISIRNQANLTAAHVTEHLGHKVRRETTAGLREGTEAVLEMMAKYEGGMEIMALTLTGVLSNIEDAFWRQKKAIADMGVFEAYKADAFRLLTLIEDFEARGGFAGIAIGFDKAYQSVRGVFFEPIFGKLEGLAEGGVMVAITVEKAFVSAFTRVQGAAMRTWRVFREMQYAARQLTEAGFFMEELVSGFPEWHQMIADFEDAEGSLFNLKGRVEDLDEALKILRRGQAGHAKIGDKEQLIALLGYDPETLIKTAEATKKEFDSVWREDKAETDLDKGKGLKGRGAAKLAATIGDLNVLKDTYKAAWGEMRGVEGPILIESQFDPLQERMTEFVGSTTTGIGQAKTLGDTLQTTFDVGSGAIDQYSAGLTFVIDQENEMFDVMVNRSGESAEIMVEHLQMGMWQAEQIFGALDATMWRSFQNRVKTNRALNALMVRGSAEVAKAVISQLTEEYRMRAIGELAAALASAAQFNFAAAAGHVASAAKYGLAVGAGAVISAGIEQQARTSEDALLNQPEPMMEGGVSTRSGSRRGSARVSRTGPETQIINVQITNHIGGDYNVSQGDLSDAEQIQELIEDGTITV